MDYRKDIDGLRAIAVIPVVLFHAGFETFSGGYVGVDVFFVISGYLITLIIAREIQEDRLSILGFYERRIRRIFPALFCMILVSMFVGLVLLLPEDLVKLGKSAIAATFFSSNILFWRQTGYFDTTAELKPLLHTWSLAVEEQFYIIFPIVLILVWRLRLPLKPFIWAVLGVSLAASIYGVRYHDEATFYLLPTRAWELLIGAIIALGGIPEWKSRIGQELISALGAGLILYAIFAFEHSTLFPGENALLPCVGAALIIYAGRSNRETCVARMLGLRPFVFIGLISYSLYLWHWPIIVFGKYYAIFSLDLVQQGIIILVSLIAAALSWRYVETPFRHGHSTFFTRNRRCIFTTSTAVMAITVIIGCINVVARGWPGRIDQRAEKIITASQAGLKLVSSCTSSRESSSYIKPKEACVYNSPNKEADTVLWGDSHAGAILPALLKAGEEGHHGIRFLSMNGCPPLLNVHLTFSRLPYCKRFNDEAMQYIESGPEKNVIIMGRWSSSLKSLAKDPGQKLSSKDEAEALLEQSIQSTMSRLRATGKTVVLVYPVPENANDVTRTLARLYQYRDGSDMAAANIKRSDYLAAAEYVISIFDRIPGNFIRVRPDNSLCDKSTCLVFKNGNSLYLDDNHLSKEGAEYVSSLFQPVFDGAN